MQAEGAITESRERIALDIEGTNPDDIEDGIVPTTDCIRDTKDRQLVTRSGLQTLRCCVCHLHHEHAMKAPSRVRQFFKTVLQQVHHFKVDVLAGDANLAAYKFHRKQQYQDLHNSSVAIMLRETQHEVNMGHHLKAD